MMDLRNAEAKARDAWLESDEGRKCCKDTAAGQYLQNRLELAFAAGIKAGLAIAGDRLVAFVEYAVNEPTPNPER